MTSPLLLTRRGFLGGALGSATLLALAACGSTSDTPTEAAAPAGVFPVRVTHKFGTTVVPSMPKRVVSAGLTSQDTLLALGVVPVGITEWYGDQPDATWPWARAALGGAKPEVLSVADSIQFERIAALRPDLIVGVDAGLTQADYTKLSAIAPTVAQSGDRDYFETWYVQAAATGTAVGRKAEVTKLIQDVRAGFATAKSQHPSFVGKKAIFLQNAVYDGSVIAYQNGLSTDFLTDLGFVVPAGLEKFAKEGQAYIPLEQLSVLDSADVLIWATEQDSDEPALKRIPGFDRLTAVQNGRSIYTGNILSGAIYFSTPLSLPYVLTNLVPMLTNVL